MTITLVPPETQRLSLARIRRSEVGVELSEAQDPGRLVKLATAFVLVYTAWFPLISLYRLVIYAPDSGQTIRAAIATTCYLPVVFWLVRAAARGRPPRAAGWILAGLACGVVATVPVVGIGWLSVLEPIAGLALIVVRWPWSVLAFAAVAATPAPLALALGQPDWAGPYTVDVVVTGVLIAVPVWLIGAARHLHAARLELARAAVIGERLRIDGELRQTLDVALAAITATGNRASQRAAADPAAAEADLRALAGASRAALATSRRLVRQYRQVSLRAELETAATLLSAAGISTRITLPPGPLPAVVSAELRTRLRSELARMLCQDVPRPCVLAVTRHHGQVRLELQPDTRPRPSVTVVSR